MSKKQNGFISDFYCTYCGNKGIPIPRKQGDKREAGHLKTLYCIKCNKRTNHVEIKPFGGYTLDKFQEEFECGRFVRGKRIPVNKLTSCKNPKCEYNRDGKCWNANYSHDCTLRNKCKKMGLTKILTEEGIQEEIERQKWRTKYVASYRKNLYEWTAK